MNVIGRSIRLYFFRGRKMPNLPNSSFFFGNVQAMQVKPLRVANQRLCSRSFLISSSVQGFSSISIGPSLKIEPQTSGGGGTYPYPKLRSKSILTGYTSQYPPVRR